jgi:hypothetical protein
MTRLLLIPLLAGVFGLSSCVVGGGKSAAKTAPAPAAPAPTVAAKPPAPPPPLSTPQTQVQLPPPQQLSPEALATIPPVRAESPAPEPSTPATKNAGTRKTTAPAGQTPPATKPDAPVQTADTPAPAQGPVAPATPQVDDQPLLAPVYTEEMKRRAWGELEKRKGEIEGSLRSINSNRLSADQKGMVDRIRSFISTAEEQAKRGDFRIAEALMDRAVILARELANGR